MQPTDTECSTECPTVCPTASEGAGASPSVAIVIPVLNEESRVGPLLAELAQLSPRPDIYVVDGGSTDSTPFRVLESRVATLVDSPRGRGIQMNLGIAASLSKSPTGILFLHVDCQLTQNAYEALLSTLTHTGVVGGAFRFAIADDTSRWAALYERGVALRCRLFRLPYGDQGFFVRTNALDDVGVFRPWPLFEDVEWFSRLRKAGPIRILDAALPTSARRLLRRGWLASALRNQLLLTLYACGASPDFLTRLYRTSFTLR